MMVKPNESSKFACVLFLRNVGGSELANLKVSLRETPNLRILHQSDLTGRIIAPGSNVEYKMLLGVRDITRPQSMSGSVDYATSLPFVINIPCSTFVLPTKISLDEFSELINSSMRGAAATLHHVFAACNVSVAPQELMQWICSNLHVIPVHSVDNTASLYGKTTQDHHVLLLVKHQPSSFRVDIRCSDATMSSSLLEEITNHFKSS